MAETLGTTEEFIRPTGRKMKDKGRKAVEKKAKALSQLVVEYLPINDLKPNEYNPNRQSDHDFELLLRSIEEDGFTQPVVVQRATKRIVDGEHRWRAAAALGLTEIPVVLVDMTDEQMRIATLRHNRARGSEDVGLASEVLRDLRELGALEWAADSLMLDDVELQKLLEDVSAPELLAGADFTESWVPGEAGGAAITRDDGTVVESASLEAIERIRDQEKRMAAATSEREKQAIKKDTDIFRVTLIYSGDEAKLVRSALGSQPAQTILQWCQENGD